MKQSIYQISNEFIELQNQLIEQDGEYSDEQVNALAINETNFENKLVGCSFVMKSFDNNINIIDEEIKRLTQLKKSAVNSKERLKTIISNAMQLFGKDEVKTAIVKLSFRKSESVNVEDVNALPNEYKVVKVTEAADKIKIKEALNNGVEIDGCSISVNYNLQIK